MCVWLFLVNRFLVAVANDLVLLAFDTLDGIVSNMHLTTRPHIRHILSDTSQSILAAA